MEEKEKDYSQNGICWVSMASEKAKYCFGDKCQAWQKKRQACQFNYLTTLSYNLNLLAQYFLWGNRPHWSNPKAKEDDKNQG